MAYIGLVRRVASLSVPVSNLRISSLRRNFNSRNFEIGTKDQDELAVSVYTIKKTLKQSGLECEDGYACIKTTCPACDMLPDPQKCNIYINKITGNFTCPSCQHGGKWGVIEKFFTNYKTSKSPKELDRYREHFANSKKSTRIAEMNTESLLNLSSLSDDRLDTLKEKLHLSNISNEALKTANCFYNEYESALYFQMTDVNGTVVGSRKLFWNDETELHDETNISYNGGILSGLLNVKLATGGSGKVQQKEPTTAILVLSVLDLLALIGIKLNVSVICLPHGYTSLPLECLPGLERYQKLIMWFNYSTAGWDTARNFSRKLDEKRCFFVRPMDSQPTPFKASLKNLDLRGIVSKAQPVLHKAITTFASLREDVLSELQNVEKVQGVKWKRYPALNRFLKGHRKGELTVLTGPTGCGKTTFMSEYSLDLAMQGVSTLWGSFEIRNIRLASTLLRQMAGEPLDEKLESFDFWADQFERLPIYFMTFHGQQSIKVVMEAIEHAQYINDIQHVIIDNVQFMMGMSDEPKHNDRFWKQDAIIAAFRTFATRRNCHVTLVIHPRKERDSEDLTTSSIFGSAKASQEADNVLIIQDKRLTSVRGKKYLQVAKNRYSGDLGVMPLEFDKASLSYATTLKKKKSDDKLPLEQEPNTNRA